MVFRRCVWLLKGVSTCRCILIVLAAASVFVIFYGAFRVENTTYVRERVHQINYTELDPSKQDHGNITKQDHGNIAKQDHGNITKQDHGNITKQDYGNITKQDQHINHTKEVDSQYINDTDKDHNTYTRADQDTNSLSNDTGKDQNTNYTKYTNYTSTKAGQYTNRIPTYIVPVRLGGQQGSGARSLSVLQCVFSSIYDGFRVVEPYFDNTRLVTYHENGGEQVKFSSLFDLEYFNEQSRKVGYPEMAEASEFIHSSPKYTVYIYIREKDSRNAFLWGRPASNWSTNCFDSKGNHSLDTLLLKDIQSFNMVSKSQSCIVRIIELGVSVFKGPKDTPWIRSGGDIYKLIFADGWIPGNVTIVLTYWYHKFFIPVHLPLHAIDCMENYEKSDTNTQFRPSKRIIRDAEKYEHTFLHDKNVLGIMLRAERVVNDYLPENKASSLSKCFSEVLKLMKSHWSNTKPIVALDIGHFGSKSFTRNPNLTEITKLSTETLVAIYGNKVSMLDWERSFVLAAGGETNKGYIAALQRTVASRAENLILMGGGNFQSLAVQDYMIFHGPMKCAYMVCMMTIGNTEVQKMVKPC